MWLVQCLKSNCPSIARLYCLFSDVYVAFGNRDPRTSSRNIGRPVCILSIFKERKLRRLTEVENMTKILLCHHPHPTEDGGQVYRFSNLILLRD